MTDPLVEQIAEAMVSADPIVSTVSDFQRKQARAVARMLKREYGIVIDANGEVHFER